jgi:hypothetical protein
MQASKAMTLDRYLMAALSGLIFGIVLLLSVIVVRSVEATDGNNIADSSIMNLRGSMR